MDFPIKDSGSLDKFWLSAQGQKYPQSLIFGFERLCSISQIQILSHESCITSRVDILTHDKSALEYNSSIDDLKFKKLGHITLDQTNRTSLQVRELKSVFINVSCCMVKLILHEPHLNKFNPANQVGIVSVSVIGEALPDSPARADRLVEIAQVGDPEGSTSESNRKMDQILFQIESLESEKREAVLVEDYDTAKAIKLKIEFLRKQLKTSIVSPSSRQNKSEEPNGFTMLNLPNFGSVEATEKLPDPDPLPSYFTRDYPQLIDALGQERIAELLSRDWRLREKGISKVMSDMLDKNIVDVYGINWIVRKCISDKVVNVFLKVCELIQQVISLGVNLSEGFLETIEFAVIHMVDYRLIEGNKRVVDAVIVSFVKIAEAESFPFVYLLKGRPNSKQINARCLCLMSLIESVGFRGKKTMNLDNLVKALSDWYQVSSAIAESRNWVVQVLRVTVKALGMHKVETSITLLDDSGVRQDLLYEVSRIGAVNRGAFTPRSMPSNKDTVVCDFCGKSNPLFSNQETMDLHYWQDCPALIQCQYCEQVVELTGLTEHRLKECEHSEDPSDFFPVI